MPPIRLIKSKLDIFLILFFVGDQWFNLPATEVTEEIKNDLEVLQMRGALDPKRFYKKNTNKELPKYFQVGRYVNR